MNRKRVVLIGASCRGYYSFMKHIMRDYSENYEFAALYDIDIRRCHAVNKKGGTNTACYDNFNLMVKEIHPDIAVIATIDVAHAEYIEKCLELGIEVVCEKPLCINAEQCKRIRKAQARHPDVRAITAHNYRYGPYMMKVKEVLDSGAIGDILSVEFSEYLDWRHGTSYFRRWNRLQANSGGLLVHKASHHFDLINWFVGSIPRTISAHGRLVKYGAANCPFPKHDNYGPNCHKCAKSKEECPFKTTLDGTRDGLWVEANKCQGYTPDLCVFDEEIDTFDHVSAGYDFENGIHVSYSLCAHSSIEGDRVALEGTKGRLELEELLNTAASSGQGVYGAEEIVGKRIRLIYQDKPVVKIEAGVIEGGHGGADTLMMQDIFGKKHSGITPTLEDGIQAVLVGSAANISIAEGRIVDIQSLAPKN